MKPGKPDEVTSPSLYFHAAPKARIPPLISSNTVRAMYASRSMKPGKPEEVMSPSFAAQAAPKARIPPVSSVNTVPAMSATRPKNAIIGSGSNASTQPMRVSKKPSMPAVAEPPNDSISAARIGPTFASTTSTSSVKRRAICPIIG